MTDNPTRPDWAPATLRAYRTDWRHFTAWCEAHGITAAPADPSDVAGYVDDLVASGHSTATIERRLTSISQVHQGHGHEPPTRAQAVRKALRQARPGRAVRPLMEGEVGRMLGALGGGDLGSLRDRAVILVGFLRGLRRAEIVAMDVGDVEPCDGRHRQSWCDSCAISAWLHAAEISEGPVFRRVDRHGNVSDDRLSDRAVDSVVKRAAAEAGLAAHRFSSESLRIGLRATMYESGEHVDRIAERCRIRVPIPVNVTGQAVERRRRLIESAQRKLDRIAEEETAKRNAASVGGRVGRAFDLTRDLARVLDAGRADEDPRIAALMDRAYVALADVVEATRLMVS